MTVTYTQVLAFDFKLIPLVESMPLQYKGTVLSFSLKSPFFLKKLF